MFELYGKGLKDLMFRNSVLKQLRNDKKNLRICYLYIEDIYFFSVNTKYISSNVLKISAISRVRSTREIADIFNS